MKYLLRLLVVLMMESAYAQNNVPACQGSDAARWSNCFGVETFTDGGKYVGEYKDGLLNGQGTFTFVNCNKYEGEWQTDGVYRGT